MRDILINEARTYILLIKVFRGFNVLVGRLKDLHFKKGFYFYIGSAQRGLGARIQRHLTKTKNIFWHIDYLLSSEYAQINEIWINSKARECLTVKTLTKAGYNFIEKFGCSDCNCKSHLFFIRKDTSQLKNILKRNGFKNADKNSFR
ncbi:MAG: hypothetical protein AMJ95_06785 [Omnitrophica WOR_2 bacterium SM23_72]|nr:MAG: hypothetical protein AMJ95_06785 [Omnitrophica WOR_2 bacterium SM23_72]